MRSVTLPPALFLVALVAAITFLILVPCGVIWSLNTLFPTLAIPLSFDTWAAVVVLYLFFSQKVSITKGN